MCTVPTGFSSLPPPGPATPVMPTPSVLPELRRIPVVAVTAFAMNGDEERIRQGGCEAYLSKPISIAKFMETVRHFLSSREAERR